MGSARFDTTMSFSRYRAHAVIRCPCGHSRTVTGRQIAAMFHTVLTITEAERRLKCSECKARRATITPIPAPQR